MVDKTEWVWMKYRRPKNTHARANNNHYHFRVFGGVSLAQVRRNDVAQMQQHREGCCGAPKRQAFFNANPNQVAKWKAGRERWTNKKGRR